MMKRYAWFLVSSFFSLSLAVVAFGQGPPQGPGGRLSDLEAQVAENSLSIETLENQTKLADLSCMADEIARFDGSSWVCAPNPAVEVEALTQALCFTVDRIGDPLRPLVCEPRCDCFQEQLDRGSVTACDEEAPGDFVAALTELRAGSCLDLGILGMRCDNSSLDPCTCEVCGALGIPYSCNCTGCGAGESCSTLPTDLTSGTCRRSCATSDDCAITEFDVTLHLDGVGEPGGDDVASCTCEGSDCTPREINSNDAAECLAQIEASLGGACTTLP